MLWKLLLNTPLISEGSVLGGDYKGHATRYLEGMVELLHSAIHREIHIIDSRKAESIIKKVRAEDLINGGGSRFQELFGLVISCAGDT